MHDTETGHHGGAALRRAMVFVAACRAAEPLGEYPHVGDLQWWCRTGALDDPADWRFWLGPDGRDLAVGLIEGESVVALVHPSARGRGFEDEVRRWAVGRLEEKARAAGPGTPYTVVDEVAEDEPARLAALESAGYTRRPYHYVCYRREIAAPLPEPLLPAGFAVRHVAGEEEATARGTLQRDAFSGTYSDESARARWLGAMRMPGYDRELDLVIVAPDGALAAGCLCWLDTRNQVGLFEPVGTRPAYRRRGLASALMVEGLRRLAARGATAALVTAVHPGEHGESNLPPDSAGRFVYERVGFRPLRRVYPYTREGRSR
jgi:GNAT superfamily N-acetyltransferase